MPRRSPGKAMQIRSDICVSPTTTLLSKRSMRLSRRALRVSAVVERTCRYRGHGWPSRTWNECGTIPRTDIAVAARRSTRFGSSRFYRRTRRQPIAYRRATIRTWRTATPMPTSLSARSASMSTECGTGRAQGVHGSALSGSSWNSRREARPRVISDPHPGQRRAIRAY